MKIWNSEIAYGRAIYASLLTDVSEHNKQLGCKLVCLHKGKTIEPQELASCHGLGTFTVLMG